METIGAYEAKTHFAQLLERVARGERITILRHGVPVAVLTPPGGGVDEVDEVVEEIRVFRRGKKLGAPGLRALIEQGRR
ncbi:MAG: type II toxin-antitoxin system prevent-host-death family antitoxin [Proteobacteria bacterium]|jgi:prevent-host-death family protein|nr:type II toxin-antitoxin system prevent-host-death family antitoxin [Pseudomonadota bacterium]